MISVVQYWPFDLVASRKTRSFRYVDATGVVPSITAVFSYDSAAKELNLAEYDAEGVWQDSWRLVYEPSLGVCEVSDWYPQSNVFEKILFGVVRKQNLFLPIEWGGRVTIGQTLKSYPKYDALTSRPPFCVHGSGEQVVKFEQLLQHLYLASGAVYENVLQFSYAQTWAGKTSGARYYAAPGVGPVAIEWIAYDADGEITKVEPRLEATVTEI